MADDFWSWLSGQNSFDPRDNAVNDADFRYGGSTPEEQAAALAKQQADAYAAARATGDFFNAHSAGQLGTGPGGQVDTSVLDAREAAARAAAGDAAAKANVAGSYAQRDDRRYQDLAAKYEGMGGVRPDFTLADQSRSGFAEALNNFRNQANGTGPSAAQAMLQQGTDRAIAGASSLANSTRGGGLAAAAARRGAMQQQGDAIAGAAAPAAQLRAQEQQAGMSNFANALMQQRGADEARAMGVASFDDAARARALQARMGFENLGAGVRTGVTNAGMQKGLANQSGQMAADAIRAKIAADNAAGRQAFMNKLIQAPMAAFNGGADIYSRMMQ